MEQQTVAHHQVIRQNTHAIGLMLEGKQDDALQLFHDALTMASKLFDDGAVGGGSSSSSCHLELTAPANTEMSCIYEVSLDEVIYPVDCCERASPDNCFKVRRCLFSVDSMHGTNNGEAVRKVLAIVTYNLGVIYHECGLACVNVHMLSHALWLYQLALAILGNKHHLGDDAARFRSSSSSSSSSDEPRDWHMIPFEMALFNNLGHVYGIFDNRQGTTCCSQRVKKMLTECGQKTTIIMDSDQYEFFQSSFLPHSHLNKAPAA